jgi:hypothetical protein
MMTLDISTVQAFLLVAELQSFTRAAEALGATVDRRRNEFSSPCPCADRGA